MSDPNADYFHKDGLQAEKIGVERHVNWPALDRQLEFRRKAKDGSYVTEADKQREKVMIDLFARCVPSVGVSVVPTKGKFDHADAELHRNGQVIGMAEAKFRDRFDKRVPTHCLQVGMEKIAGMYDEYCPGWFEGGPVKPIILISEIYINVDMPSYGTEVYAVSLSAFHPWLIEELRLWKKQGKHYRGYAKKPHCPHISWVENKYSDKGHGHYCLWIPLQWCSMVTPGFDISLGIKCQDERKRKEYANEKYHGEY